ncbi:MAG: conjugal transfer protein TraX [Corallococcus sp.]|nr:conjugal transfer protein TraX [Corallococcus sp.]
MELSEQPKRYQVLNSNVLKSIAIAAMTLDHLAWAIWQGFSTNGIALTMHIIGRLTCPIMCYFIAEGYCHTKNLKRYIGRMFLFAVISHFPYVFCQFNYIDPLSFVPFAHGSPFNQTGVLWGFAWGLVLIRVHDSKLKMPVKIILHFLILAVSFPADWSCIAPLVILFFWFNRGKFAKQMLWMMFWVFVYGVVYFFALDKIYGILQLAVCLAIPLLLLYNGQRGKYRAVNKVLKWLFYIYYPLHLTVIGLLLYFGVFPIF